MHSQETGLVTLKTEGRTRLEGIATLPMIRDCIPDSDITEGRTRLEGIATRHIIRTSSIFATEGRTRLEGIAT